MSAFLLLLVKLNLAMGAAIVLVSLLRRPLRLLFGAPIAYAIWLLVPSAGMASLFPPRVVAPAPLAHITPVPAAPVSVMGHIAHSALRVSEQLTGQSAPMFPVIAAPPPAPAYAMPDTALLLFAAWALGMLLMALYLTRLQLRFSAAVQLGKAGPAVLGFLRPRIVTPDGFPDHFTPQEQAAILAHEHIHLARQDARINALTAFLRCLCWFNPFIHLGARWLRIDQELACDATAVAGAISRRDYAKALLKSQMMVRALPLGCNWPGPQHPLIERIALLKRKPPGTARRLAGVSLVMLAATFAGLGAWAAQPAAAAKPMAAPQPGMMLAALPAMVMPSPTAKESAADANPVGSGNDAETPKNAPANRALSPAPASAPTPRTVSIDARTESALAALPQMASISEPSDKTIADQSTSPTSQDASPAPKDMVAQNSAGGPVTANVTVAAAPSGAPRPKTELALACLLGMARAGCETVFVGAGFNMPFNNNTRPLTKFEAGRIISYCSEEYVHRVLDRCPAGPLETVQYLGTNFAGGDVYIAKFMHQENTYVISQPTPDGKIPALWRYGSSPNWVVRWRRLVELQPPVLPARIIYSREPLHSAP